MGLKSQISKRSPSLPMILFVISCYFHVSFFRALVAIHLAQVPTITAERYRQAAREENGFRVEPESSKGGQPSWKKNASREAWRMFNRCQMGWRVPISKYVFDTGMDFTMDIPLHCPKGHYWIHAGETPRTPGWWAAEFWREGFPHQSLLVCISFDWTQPHGVSRASR